MGLTGKYDFKGIQKAGAFGLRAILAGTSWGASLVVGPWKTVIDFFSELIVNFLANKGLILINVGAIVVDGYLDQKKFDAAIDEGLAKVKVGGLTPKQGKAIDDNVIEALDEFGSITHDN